MNMGRLTERNDSGGAFYPCCFQENGCDGAGASARCNECNFFDEICEKLASYEDVIDAPSKLKEMDSLYLERCEEINRLNAKLGEYKRLEDEGLLFRLPCRVGDTVCRLKSPDENEYYKTEVSRIEIYNNSAWLCFINGKANNVDEIGKNVFLTCEEAEQALEEMKGEKIDAN